MPGADVRGMAELEQKMRTDKEDTAERAQRGERESERDGDETVEMLKKLREREVSGPSACLSALHAARC